MASYILHLTSDILHLTPSPRWGVQEVVRRQAALHDDARMVREYARRAEVDKYEEQLDECRALLWQKHEEFKELNKKIDDAWSSMEVHPPSYILFLACYLLHPTSYILPPTTCAHLLHPTSYILPLHPTSHLTLPTSTGRMARKCRCRGGAIPEVL